MLRCWEPPTDPDCEAPFWYFCKECGEMVEKQEACYPYFDRYKATPCCSEKCARVIDIKSEEHLPEEKRTWWDD